LSRADSILLFLKIVTLKLDSIVNDDNSLLRAFCRPLCYLQ